MPKNHKYETEVEETKKHHSKAGSKKTSHEKDTPEDDSSDSTLCEYTWVLLFCNENIKIFVIIYSSTNGF